MSSRRSRMSLGGGALRKGVLDGSSRYNVRTSAASDDEYQTTPKKSAYASGLRQRSSSVSRRESFGGDNINGGGGGLLSRSNYATGINSSTGISAVDRRAMLEKWRQQRNGGGGISASTDAGGVDAASTETRKRNRGDPPLPPASKQHRSTASSTHTYYSHSHSQDNNIYYSQGGGGTIEYSDDEMENRNTSVRSGRTPSSNRRTTMGSGARRKTPLLGKSVIQSSSREGKKSNYICPSRFVLAYLLAQIV